MSAAEVQNAHDPALEKPGPAALSEEEQRKRAYYEAPQWTLIVRRFQKHRVAFWMAYVTVALYLFCMNCHFFSPGDPAKIHAYHVNQPPQKLQFGYVDGHRWPRLYVHPMIRDRNPVTLAERYRPDLSRRLPIRFWVHGYPWRFLGMFKTDRHMFGVEEERLAGGPGRVVHISPTEESGRREARLSGLTSADWESLRVGDVVRWVSDDGVEERILLHIDSAQETVRLAAPLSAAFRAEGVAGEIWRPHRVFLLGTGALGQDVFSRILHGGRISLLIGLMGVILSFFLGIMLGGISGYFGGRVDMVIQRTAEILMTIPKIPIWLALAAAIPKHWSSLAVYFAMTLILASMGWTGLCRVVRGKLLSLREEDYARAAVLAGASEARIIFVHLLPNFTSHLIASLTLAIPGMILSETSLSFLGLGLRPPIVSWGVLLQQAQSVEVVENQPWMLLPALAVIVAVLAFNFVGEGLRDAADPYS
jgi:ABC-type dipeptide/oligopeptide/nickel transport system permease subunit